MKKNLMSVLILALVLVNTILTAILAIGIIPSVKKSNQLVETVASAINLELNGANGESAASVPMAHWMPCSSAGVPNSSARISHTCEK